MKKRAFLAAGLAACMLMTGCSSTSTPNTTDDEASSLADTSVTASSSEVADESTPVALATDILTGTYSWHIGGYDWGCGTDKVILSLSANVDAVTADNFKVTETKQTTDWTSENYDIIETTVDREVTAAYLCDAEGNEVSEASNYVALELYVSPNDGSPLLFSMTTQYNTYSDPYYLTITAEGLTSGGTEVTSVDINTEHDGQTTDADAFVANTFTSSDGVEYNYVSYTPETDTETLFVWLHGMGEGGSAATSPTDGYIPVLANKVTALAGEEFQSLIGGAYVLAPQCPTYWMDSDGQSGNFNDGSINADGTSFYTESLNELIDSYAAEVGATKIIVGGCSNGGYMTVLMAAQYGDKYAAIVPIAEAMPDEALTDDQIAALAKVPSYYIYSNDDTTVDPTTHEVPTIERLQAAGATDLHVFAADHVVDTSGLYKDENGDPYQYMGHWSWVYFDNDDTDDGNGLSAWNWLAGIVNQ